MAPSGKSSLLRENAPNRRLSRVQNTRLFCYVLDRIDALTVCPPCCPSKGRESRRSPLRAGHQAAQQPVGIQRLLQCAALCAGLAAEGGLPGARLQELGAERRLGQRGGGGVPRASRQVAKGESLEAEPGLLLIWQTSRRKTVALFMVLSARMWALGFTVLKCLSCNCRFLFRSSVVIMTKLPVFHCECASFSPHYGILHHVWIMFLSATDLEQLKYLC